MKSELSEAFNFGSDFTYELINVSENQTFRIDCADGRKFALRLARPGYHTADEFASEMAWIEALQKAQTVPVAKPIHGRDGNYLQQVAAHNALLFEWVEGAEPQITDNLMGLAEQLGALAAQLHNHALQWNRPNNFTRPRWDFQATLGSEMRWGDWRNGLGVKPYMLPMLSRTVNEVEQRLKIYGENEQRLNLIHGDLRLANLLKRKSQVTVIDFDDCGFGWLMYDAATMISFHEHEAQAPEMIQRWIEGYRNIRQLSVEDEQAIQTLIMLRRILLLAWLGSHRDIDLARQVEHIFADQSLSLCELFLSSGKVF
jgi:Ser/Thr protein kinase RdoA (MazF antagonist)